MDTDPTAIDNYGPFTIVRVSDGEEGEGEFAAMLTAHWATTDQHVNCVGCEYIAEGCKSAAEVRSEIDKLGPPPGYKLELGIDEKRELDAAFHKLLEMMKRADLGRAMRGAA